MLSSFISSQFELLTPAADAGCKEVGDTELASILSHVTSLHVNGKISLCGTTCT